MTPLQIALINALLTCRFLPGCFDKRFVRSLASQDATKSLSQKQDACLIRIFHKYRRQIRAYEEICLKLNPDAFTLEFDLLGDMVIKPVTKKGKPIIQS